MESSRARSRLRLIAHGQTKGGSTTRRWIGKAEPTRWGTAKRAGCGSSIGRRAKQTSATSESAGERRRRVSKRSKTTAEGAAGSGGSAKRTVSKATGSGGAWSRRRGRSQRCSHWCCCCCGRCGSSSCLRSCSCWCWCSHSWYGGGIAQGERRVAHGFLLLSTARCFGNAFLQDARLQINLQ